ncbi:bifunctional folylpolyglutamate synthase/dihydrofolate synthase [Sphingomonas prati]|uniref:Dihydrofolate synthase/folylpolyglutamate synthase n=1 Tax=Sphingomonas prati TaxID=1843237 RepID=A0A7W9BR29_9SPHN|nr:bifunctional folylpolyglutamate synthase/dihydrofolate synthase [Sphingomonas prati]MBB5728411.1 dihydrofolate synthase/folylpolyglutamate synthase [Sphingomonas prati]GGE74008.1 bifunctional folylpolyglutamate synthase/dihydrofolate synthase [Sphingomonas prati]
MADHAISSDPAVQAQLDRLASLSPGADILGLERISALLARLGDPQLRMPPVLHVAGTNGKGSTCAFLRATIEGAGLTAHVYTSPHLVRFNERIRLAGTLIDDALLAALLAEVLNIAGDISPSFFEVTTAAAFLAFARVPADACIVEVGLGGRLDATNVLAAPAACGIAQLGVDHQAFLGDRIEDIAAEKAGIARAGVPLVTMAYAAGPAERVAGAARSAGADLLRAGDEWFFAAEADGVCYTDTHGTLLLEPPALDGAHQAANLALAVAMLRHQRRIAVPDAALVAAGPRASWPARMQRIDRGALFDRLPAGADLHIDGAHNPAAAMAIAPHLAALRGDGRPLVVVVGLLANKDADGVLGPLAGVSDRLIAVPVPGHATHDPVALADAVRGLGVRADAEPDIAAAFGRVIAEADPARPPHVVVLGSLYLAGTVLAANGTPPD